MEKAQVIALLEKYWQAETTIVEEQALADYFRGGRVDADLLVFSDLFAYFREEAQVSAGPDFGDRILERLALEESAGVVNAADMRAVDMQAADMQAADMRAVAKPPAVVTADVTAPGEVPAIVPTREPFRFGVLAAAAAIFAIVAGLHLLTPAGRPTILASNDTAATMHEKTARTPEKLTAVPEAGFTDTYDDPEKALAAVRHALLIASNHLNQGRRQLTAAHK